MTMIYEAIGRLVVTSIRWRFGRQIQIAGGVALVGVLVGGAVGAYLLATREVDEG